MFIQIIRVFCKFSIGVILWLLFIQGQVTNGDWVIIFFWLCYCIADLAGKKPKEPEIQIQVFQKGEVEEPLF